MKADRRRPRSHAVDALFTVALFCVFLATALMVVIIGARVYRGTVENMNRNFDTRTSVTYVSTKIRQNDRAGAVSLRDFEGVTALVLEQRYGDDVYETLIYHHEGMLKELFVRQGSEIGPDGGQAVMEVDFFHIRSPEKGLYELESVDRNGNPVKLQVHTRS